MTKVNEIVNRIENFAPKYLAEDWDPIGLSIGSKNQKVKKMMVALDLDRNTISEAKEKNVDFIFTHHPAIFSSLKTLNEEEARRREYIDLIRSEISLYSAHTNIDLAENGMNDWLAEAIDLKKPYKIMDISCENPEGQGKSFGLGRVGELKEEISIEELIEKIKKAYQIDNVRSSNNEWTYRVKKVAIVGGSGEKYYQQALEHEVDVYITGDISYHGAQDMMRDGLAFIDPGHYIEHVFVEKMTSMLKQWNKEENWGIEIISAKKQKDVFRFK